jgi:DNA ligase (NAD+)
MNRDSASQRILKLRELINDYRYNYHVLNKSIMSEAAADSLKHELAGLEELFPDLITSDSPTQRVAGGVLPGFSEVAHRQRMLSLNDVFNRSEIEAWLARISKAADLSVDRIELFCDIKMDGLACALIYRDGLLERGVTRGDGFVGENVTANIRTIDSVPLALRSSKQAALFLKGTTEVRGEILMYKADFESLNEQRVKDNLPPFANPRNTAAGTIRQLDPALVSTRPLHFRAYDLIREEPGDVPSYSYAYEMLRSLGFSVNPMASVFIGLDRVMNFIDQWEAKRHRLDFNTDGLVIKVNDRTVYEKLGVVGKAPRGAVAYKYAAEQATTRVKDILVSIGRTGAATPVAVLEPVQIAGSTVQMATLHNESEIERKDIRIGDSVIVHKAGDIIPEIVQPLIQLRSGEEKVFKMPKICPDCGSDLVKKKSDEAVWRCPNHSCPSRSWKQIQHYASKEALDIEGLGEKNVIALLDAKLIKDAADIYSLRPEQLMQLERFAEISANKLIAAIQEKKQPPLARFLYGLGIRHIGIQTAVDLANKFKNLDAIAAATTDSLAQVDGVGEIVAESLVEYFSEPRSQQLLAKFKQTSVWPQPVTNTGGSLVGRGFVISGTLNSLSREEAAEKIRSLGGTFQSSVGKETDYLVIGDNPGSSKIAKANQLKTQILNEAQFLAMLD